MKYLLLILFLLSLIIIMAGFLPMRTTLRYRKDNKNDILTILIELKPFFRKTIKIPKIMFKIKNRQPALEIEVEQSQQSTPASHEQEPKEDIDDFSLMEAISHFNDIIQTIRNFHQTYYQSVRYIMKKTTCEWFEWHTQVGNHNPAVTGIGTGLVWNIKSQIIGFLSHTMNFTTKNPPQIFVAPDFQEPKFYVQLDCIFTIKLGHIIKAGFEMGLTKLKNGISLRQIAHSLHAMTSNGK